jgi:non-ribosomal peptide synthetase component E (peptide arylation enzyme)
MDAGGLSACSVEDPPEVRFFMVGSPHPGNEIKILDKEGREVPTGEVGTINFRGPGAAGGYYKDEKMTEEKWGSGWFNMGDLGKLDDNGNLMIVGREKDVINRGGQNIYSAEVENAIQTHPKIVSAALVAYPDKVMGERACVFIRLANKSDEITLEELGSFLKGRGLSAYKCPERIEFIDMMPLVSDTKIDKKVLKSMLDKKLVDETR